jgi:hypothetical protein
MKTGVDVSEVDTGDPNNSSDLWTVALLAVVFASG